jgi:hypothetical protein
MNGENFAANWRDIMVYQGTIQNGVVVLENGVQLPEGASVKVELVPLPTASDRHKLNKDELDPIFRMGELAEDAGIPDLSVNIDHYLYGHPKVTDAQ